jgi:sarcosine oxidase gamma subunit
MASALMDNLRDLGIEDGFSADAFSVRWDHGLRVASLRYFDPAGPFAAEAGEVLGGPIPLPLRAHRRLLVGTGDFAGASADGAGTAGSELVVAWRSPTETLLVTADAGCLSKVDRFAANRSDGCLVDQTGGILTLVVAGARAPDLLTRLGSTDAVPALGEARSSRMAELSVVSLCTRPGEILLLVERVYARHLFGWIRETVADFKETGAPD